MSAHSDKIIAHGGTPNSCGHAPRTNKQNAVIMSYPVLFFAIQCDGGLLDPPSLASARPTACGWPCHSPLDSRHGQLPNYWHFERNSNSKQSSFIGEYGRFQATAFMLLKLL